MISHHSARDAGFTLVELLVALTVVGLVTGYALQSLSGALAQLASSRDVTVATSVAQSALARVGQDIPFGKEVAGASGAYDWVAQSRRFTAISVPVASGVAAYTVVVKVSWRERGRQRQIEMETVGLAYQRLGS
ncbi:type II secretion system protein [Acidisoma cellulosilytica]|uniref:Type II secretion system protein n=1 Tax=Acidisoma cellulosilyticum TaxID=2802395 RepID=A0A964E500_9PROT|nr:type II secretion system protein [Acidisoma cellulosilyticum]MCB8881478.1 type II secretion system protein [Acidisoma cellulosilyticum]